ncbi:MAG TPA: ATP-dependent DNA helicase [Solirubrobacterales bacterium]|nr:ATP-dependent DNA helicase [Solirubrobacterales bacterium]
MEASGYDGTDEAQSRIVGHRAGPLLVTGTAGSGGSEALVRRFVSLVEDGVRAEHILLASRTRAGAARLRDRVETLLAHPHEELWIGTHGEIAERILRQHPTEAGLDPFFTIVTAADRLAILLDRVDDLPLRRHEIRGNPAGLLARLLRRIDLLKLERVTPERLRDWASASEREATRPAQRERARREAEFAELYARHDRVVAEAGSLDEGDLVLEAARLLEDRSDVRAELTMHFVHVMVDELEDAAPAHMQLVEQVVDEGRPNIVAAHDPDGSIRRFRGAGQASLEWFREIWPGAAETQLTECHRFGPVVSVARWAILGQPAEVATEPEDGSVRFWRCDGERAQAQAAAREVEVLLSAGETLPERICIIVGSGWRQGRLVAAALEERSVPFRLAGDASFFARAEVRDLLAWLRMLADPFDASAVVRALTRPPVDLRSADLARVTTIARRRKLDMVSALDAALESPQLRPEARDRIQAFLKLQRSAATAMEAMRPDVFVRRLIERVGMRRHRLFAATPETAERLVNLSRLAELAADWSRRVPRGSVRDFVRHIAAVAEAGEVGAEDADPPAPGAVLLAEPTQVKGMEFDAVYLLGLHAGSMRLAPWEDRWVPEELASGALPEANDDLIADRQARLAYLAVSRATRSVVLSWPEEADREAVSPAPFYEAARDALGAGEEVQAEEVFGPAEGLHATYRMIRDEVLESSWRAGSALSEMRLDTAEDLNAAVARYLELIKLASLLQRPGQEAAREALGAVNELIARVASPEQRAVLETSTLDDFVLGEEKAREDRRAAIAARREPSLEQFIPRRGEGLALSASDIGLYRMCPLKYKFARVFAIPQEPTVNQRFGILIHNVLERFHSEEMRSRGGGAVDGLRPGSLDRLLGLLEAGWRRTGFGASDDELQYRDRAVAALARYHERHLREESEPVWLERSFSFAIGDHHLRGRIDRVDKRPDGAYELIDYKTGEQSSASKLSEDLQLALYRVAAREAWELEATQGAYWYVLSDERVEVEPAPDDAERVERTVLDVAGGIEAQDFEPRPSFEICSWCDYRLICPASEA